MAKFCAKCGSSVVPGAAFCYVCGAQIEDSPADNVRDSVDPSPVEQIPFRNSFATSFTDGDKTSFEKSAQKPKKKPFKSILALVLVAVLIVSAASFCGVKFYISFNNIDENIDLFVDAIYLGDADALEKSVPEELVESYSNISSSARSIYKKRSRAMDKAFGENIKISYDIEDIEYVPSFNRYYYADKISGFFDDFNCVEVQKVYRVLFGVTVKGDADKETYYYNVAAIKTDNRWFLFDLQNGLPAYYYAVNTIELDML